MLFYVIKNVWYLSPWVGNVFVPLIKYLVNALSLVMAIKDVLAEGMVSISDNKL